MPVVSAERLEAETPPQLLAPPQPGHLDIASFSVSASPRIIFGASSSSAHLMSQRCFSIAIILTSSLGAAAERWERQTTICPKARPS
jgi:hypothetical protein